MAANENSVWCTTNPNGPLENAQRTYRKSGINSSVISSLVNLLLILCFFAGGYLLKGSLSDPGRWSLQLNRYIINLALPALVLQVIPALELRQDMLLMLISPWLIMGVSAAAVVLFQRIYQWDRQTFGAALILAALGNTGFLGFPLIQAFFTEQQLGAAVIFDQFGSFIGLCTYATFLIAYFSGSGLVQPSAVIKRIVLFPPFVALIVSLWLPANLFDGFLENTLDILSWTIMPCAMISIGLQFSFRAHPSLIRPVMFVLLLKMVLAPLVVLTVGLLIGSPDWLLDVAIFEAAAPPMVTPAVMLIASGLAPRFAASTLGFGTLIALLYLPLLAMVLNFYQF